MSRRVLWLDLETTGLDETLEKSGILEVAIILTDNLLNPLHIYQNAVHQPEYVLEAMNDWCKRTHGESGLVAEVRASKKSLAAVEDDLLEILLTFNREEKIILAGNSIHFDKKWIDRHMPRLAAKLQYRLLDVSTFKEALDIFLMPVGTKGKPRHRALDDVRGSIEEFRGYLKVLEKGVAS